MSSRLLRYPARGDVLIVDDELDNLSLLSTTLVEEGYRVRKAINGTMALMGAQTDPPDLILLDILMPGIDGYEIFQQLKADSRTYDVPVIFLTVLDEVKDIVKGFAIGGVDYITKPFYTEEVVARVKNQMTIQLLRKQLQIQNAELIEINKNLLQVNTRLNSEIDERRRLEVEQERLLASEQAANRAKDDFLATVSHELRTPLVNMKMAIQMLEIVSDPAQRNRYLQILAEECDRETELVNELLELQRLEAGAVVIERVPLQLQTWLPLVVARFMSRAESDQQNLQVSIALDLPILLTDVTYLEKIVSELINNACKYTPVGGEIKVTAYLVAVTSKSSYCGVALTISNSSLGMTPAELERIFEKFYRAYSSHPTQQTGTGLGLALVKQLVELLGGTIQAESQAGQVTFTIKF